MVRDVILGHEEALVAVWRRHGPAVRRTLYAQLGRDDSIDDLLQEVFLAFTHGAARITQPDRLRSYLMAAAVRQARQAIRDRSRRRRWLGLLAEDRRGASIPPAVHSRDALRRLRDILDHLPDRLRESFILRFVEGLPTVEVAEIRGVSLATAKRDVAKAHDRVLFQSRRDPALTDYLRGTGAASQLRDVDLHGGDASEADASLSSDSSGGQSVGDSYPPESADSERAAASDSYPPDSHPSGSERDEEESDLWSSLDGSPELSRVDGLNATRQADAQGPSPERSGARSSSAPPTRTKGQSS